MYNGGLAQLGERLPYKQDVTGSNPVSSISLGIVKSYNLIHICGCGGTGRRARFRFLYLLDVGVRFPSSALRRKSFDILSFAYNTENGHMWRFSVYFCVLKFMAIFWQLGKIARISGNFRTIRFTLTLDL